MIFFRSAASCPVPSKSSCLNSHSGFLAGGCLSSYLVPALVLPSPPSAARLIVKRLRSQAPASLRHSLLTAALSYSHIAVTMFCVHLGPGVSTPFTCQPTSSSPLCLLHLSPLLDTDLQFLPRLCPANSSRATSSWVCLLFCPFQSHLSVTCPESPSLTLGPFSTLLGVFFPLWVLSQTLPLKLLVILRGVVKAQRT